MFTTTTAVKHVVRSDQGEDSMYIHTVIPQCQLTARHHCNYQRYQWMEFVVWLNTSDRKRNQALRKVCSTVHRSNQNITKGDRQKPDSTQTSFTLRINSF
jgi:glutamate synthase domain-containing protein 2